MGYQIVSLYFFLMILSVMYWAAIIKALGSASYSMEVFLLCTAICIYIFGYALELNSATQEQILFWNRFEYLGIPFVSALWLTVALKYTERYAKHRVGYTLFIYVIPVLTLILRQTNDLHHLYFASVQFVVQNGKLLLTRIYGPWMFVQTFHSMAMILIAMGLLLRSFYVSKVYTLGKLYLVVLASLLAVVGLVLSYMKPFGVVLDYMALCLPLSCLIVIFAIARYDFLELRSLARSKSFDANQDAIILIGNHERIFDFNRNASQLLARKGITLSKDAVDKVLHGVPLLQEAMTRDEASIVPISFDEGTAETRYFEISTNWVDRDARAQVCIKTLRDVTTAYELNLNLQQQVMYDDLSNLHNRRAFVSLGSQRIEKAIAMGESVAFLMMDLDRFKAINDSYGHPTGDLVIRQFADTLKQSYPPEALLARLGGEEFGVLVSGVHAAQVRECTERFVQTVATGEYGSAEQALRVTASVGIVYSKRPERYAQGTPRQSLYRLMAMADKAMYRAKEAGRNQVFLQRDVEENADGATRG